MYEYKEFWRKWNDINSLIDMEDYIKVWLLHLLIFAIALPVLLFNGENLYWYIVSGYFVLAFIPIITMTIRGLNDNGVSRLNILWILLPVVGVFIIITKMVSKTNNGVWIKSSDTFHNRKIQNRLKKDNVRIHANGGFMRK